jgi:hypothetical protein
MERQAAVSKIDFKTDLKNLYNPPAQFTVVDVPPMQYLMVDGMGNPNTAPAYTHAVEALYAVAYKLKFMSKSELDKDYVVPPLEGLWWAEDMDAFTVRRDKDTWLWTMMILTPDWITSDVFASASAAAQKAKGLTTLPRLEIYREGLSVQIMHTGSYDDETSTLHQLHTEFMPQNGYVFNGKHHEIYLSDPRKVAPEKLKTVLRQPVKRA